MQLFALTNRMTSIARSCSWHGIRSHFSAFIVGVLFAPQIVSAGFLSRGICRPYRQLVDNELFLMVAVIAGAVLVLMWKLAPSGTYLQKGVGLLAALAIGLNLENFLQAAFGGGLAC